MFVFLGSIKFPNNFLVVKFMFCTGMVQGITVNSYQNSLRQREPLGHCGQKFKYKTDVSEDQRYRILFILKRDSLFQKITRTLSLVLINTTTKIILRYICRNILYNAVCLTILFAIITSQLVFSILPSLVRCMTSGSQMDQTDRSSDQPTHNLLNHCNTNTF